MIAAIMAISKQSVPVDLAADMALCGTITTRNHNQRLGAYLEKHLLNFLIFTDSISFYKSRSGLAYTENQTIFSRNQFFLKLSISVCNVCLMLALIFHACFNIFLYYFHNSHGEAI